MLAESVDRAAGRMASLTDAEGNTTAWLYDDVGRVVEEMNRFRRILVR